MTEKEIERFSELAKSFEVKVEDLLNILERSDFVQKSIECAVDYMYERDLSENE